MLQTNLLAHGHSDLVTHLAYDFYGERCEPDLPVIPHQLTAYVVATCSADQRIKIFRRSTEGLWELEADWKAHDAPILRLSFAHPLHGSLLASCSHDRTVRIWEEPSSAAMPGPAAANGQTTRERDGRWTEKAILSGAKGSVRDVSFGPPDPSVGLRIASISTDSHLRIHTSLDPDLSDWSLAHDILIPSLAAPDHAEDQSGSNGGASGPPGQTEGASAGQQGAAQAGSAAEMAQGGWGLSWCKERWWGSVIAAFAGMSPVVKLIALDPQPTSLLHLAPPNASTAAPLTSLSWAPNCGRSYHLLATGARDGTVRIWRVQPPDAEPEQDDVKPGWSAEIVAEFEKGARIGMVDWNATGTTLTASDDEGVIRIYKATYAKEWKLAGKMSAEEPSEESNGQ